MLFHNYLFPQKKEVRKIEEDLEKGTYDTLINTDRPLSPLRSITPPKKAFQMFVPARVPKENAKKEKKKKPKKEEKRPIRRYITPPPKYKPPRP